MKGKFRINHLRIKELIGEKKLTIDQFAEKLNVSRNSIYGFMSKDFVSIDVAERMAFALGVELSEIKAGNQNDGESVGFDEIKKMLENIISQQFETIKSQQLTIQTLAGVLGKLNGFDEIPVEINEVEGNCILIDFRPVFSTIKTA